MNKIKQMTILISALVSLMSSVSIANPIVPEWVLVDSTAPARSHFKCVYDRIDKNIILFGGIDSSGRMPNDTWRWNHDSWSPINYSGPRGRVDFGMCFDDWHNQVIIFGGQDSAGNYLNDTWALTDSGWFQLDVQGPSPRSGFAMSFTEWDATIYLFGGTDGQNCFDDTWSFDGVQWVNHTTMTTPEPRVHANSIEYGYFSVMMIFGGVNCAENESFNDNWMFTGADWFKMDSTFASHRKGQMMAYDFYDYFEGTTVFGGVDVAHPDSFFEDTWLFNDQWGWSEIAWNGPPGRAFGEMVYDDSLDMILLIGGTDGTQTFHDIWEFPYIEGPCDYVPGDINGNHQANGVDIVYFVNYLKGLGDPPPMECGAPFGYCAQPSPFYPACDVNGNCQVNGIDVTYFVRYLKLQVPNLLSCPDCPPTAR